MVLFCVKVLVADINIGYEEIVNTQVLAFNGKEVKNLKSLANMVESCRDDYLKFELEYQQVGFTSHTTSISLFVNCSFVFFDVNGRNVLLQIVVLETKTAKAATVDILLTHCIPSAMSDDLKT